VSPARGWGVPSSSWWWAPPRPTRRSRTARASAICPTYRAADVYVHAAPAETFCLAAAEALACGTPVVMAAAGGPTEIIDTDRTGVVVPAGDDAGAADAVMALLADDGRRARMGALGAEAVRERFSRTRSVAALHAYCEEIVAGPAATPVDPAIVAA
jgi:glycosyltransferase involved in cell wall biosynthesis